VSFYFLFIFFIPLSANVVHARHGADVACSGCSASYRKKYIKNDHSIFDRGEHLLKNGILHFVLRFSQLSEIALENYNLCKRKTDFFERGLVLKVLKFQIYILIFNLMFL